ncbi:MAG: type II toxin-antitoxin system HicB family antitoxin [Oceanicaulis sp.]
MTVFIGVVHKDDDSAFGIHFPDAPGCFSAAERFEDLPHMAAEALALWSEDAEPVIPRSFDSIRQDSEVVRDLKQGAVLLAVPLISLSGRTVKANLTLDAGLLQAIDAAAKARGLSRSAFMADAARRELTG